MDSYTSDGQRRSSSVYSGVSFTATRLNPNGNGAGKRIIPGGHSRPSSHASNTQTYVPSYMSHVPSRSHASSLSITVPNGTGSTVSPSQPAAVDFPTSEISIMAPRGQLLVLAAGVIQDSTLPYIEMLVSRQDFSGIVLIASPEQETSLKALKMSCFALIGKLSKEMSVTMHFRDDWSHRGVEQTVQQIAKAGEGIQGVLCCPASPPEGTEAMEILKMGPDDLQQAWATNIAFVQSVTLATMDHLLSRCKIGSRKPFRPPQGPFFLLSSPPAYSAASQIVKTACDSLVLKLHEATRASGLTVAYAENVLIPDPAQPEAISQATSGPFSQPDEVHYAQQDAEYASPESPTKLWALWSGAADI